VGFSWRPRELPLEPCAVVATGDTVRRLAARLLELGDEALRPLRTAGSARALVVLAALENLPWADGVRYVGRDPRAPGLLWPTSSEPTLPAALVERALRSTLSTAATHVVLPEGLLIPTELARAPDRETLSNFMASPGA
jgi:hypothetical protein